MRGGESSAYTTQQSQNHLRQSEYQQSVEGQPHPTVHANFLSNQEFISTGQPQTQEVDAGSMLNQSDLYDENDRRTVN